MVISYAIGSDIDRIRVGTSCADDSSECVDVRLEPKTKCEKSKNEENCPVTCKRIVHHGSGVKAKSEDWFPTTEDKCNTNQGSTEYKLLACRPTEKDLYGVVTAAKYLDTDMCGSVFCGLSLTSHIEKVKSKIEKVSSPESLSRTGTPQYRAMDLIIKKQLCTHKDSFVDTYVGYVLAFTWDRFRTYTNRNSISENLCQSNLVRCNSLGKIIHINLAKKQLVGAIPDEISYLEKLRTLRLNHNKLTGTIPKHIGNLSELYFLHLSNNQITGTLPTTLYNMIALKNLYLQNNKLGGDLKYDVYKIDKLVRLDLSNNEIGGQLPPSFPDMGNLVYVNLAKNLFQGFCESNLCNIIGKQKQIKVFKVDCYYVDCTRCTERGLKVCSE